MKKYKININIINEIENVLYNYKFINTAIDNLKLELDNMDSKVNTKDKLEITKTNVFKSEVENYICKREEIESKIKFLKVKLTQINRALNMLSIVERKVIENFYIEDKRYCEFSDNVGFSESTCKRIKNKALTKIYISLYGDLNNAL